MATRYVVRLPDGSMMDDQSYPFMSTAILAGVTKLGDGAKFDAEPIDDLDVCAWCPAVLPAKNETGRPAYCSQECYLSAGGAL